MNRFTASLHTHVRSLYDADIDANALCAKIKDLGGKGIAVTDHGVLSSIEDFKAVFNREDLKLIPGVELYVDGGILGRLHLVLLARNDHGYLGISKIVTKSNYSIQNGYPVISKADLFEMMKDYKGDIFALSACMQGVISAIFLTNEAINKKMSKIKDKMSKYVAPMSEKDIEAEEDLKTATAEVERLTALRDEYKEYAEMKFSRREKEVAKLQKEADPYAEVAKAELDADMEKAKTAAKEIEIVKDQLSAAKKALSAASRAQKDVSESIDAYLKLEEDLKTLKKELKGDDELFNIALEEAKEYEGVFGKKLFLAEIQYHGIPEEAICFPKVVEVANALNIPIVATNDVHILENTADERLKRQILRSLRFGETFESEQVGDSELYLKDNFELKEALIKIVPEDVAVKAIENIDVVFNACNVEFKSDKHYPKFRE